MEILETQSVWERMKTCKKPLVLYGMGNGADKILSVMERYGLEPADFFASDGFVRGHSFHGKEVLSYSAVCEKYGDMMVIISFASALPEVLERFDAIDARYETVAPDVPVSGNEIFTGEYYLSHKEDFEAADALLADEESHEIYQNLINYKISGKLPYLRAAVSDRGQVMQTLVKPDGIRSYMDLGAYNGDTVREMLEAASNLHTVYAMEPDARNYKKLSAYAQTEERAAVHTYPYAAWSENTELLFRVEGNRNSTVSKNGTAGIAVTQAKEKRIAAASPDSILSGTSVDFIKYDVEGAEAEALRGSESTIRNYAPTLLVSLYHRTEDLFSLPLYLHTVQPRYRFYLRRFPYVPAWDINLYCISE